MKPTLFFITLTLLATSGAFADNWYDRITMSGDFYYRHELLDAQERDTLGNVSDYQRNRHVIKARLNIEGQVTPSTKVHFRLASGQPKPPSNAQTLDEGFSTKSIYIDLIYFYTEPGSIPKLSLTGGKIRNPFYRVGVSELIWDSDVNPEGLAASYTIDYTGVSTRLVAAGLWVEEQARGDDSYLAALQGMIKYHPEEESNYALAGATFYNYVNTKSYGPFFDPDIGYGNTLDENGHYQYSFELVELFGEGVYELMGQPLTLFGHYVVNTDPDSANEAWLAGLRYGKLKSPGTFSVRYMYRRMEHDAVIGIFTDWAFRHGGTDAKGHELGFDFRFAPNTTLALTYFDVKYDLADPMDFRKLHAQVNFDF